MDFRIADTFTDSLARLTGDEQKAAKTTAFDLQLNPAAPGLNLHKLDKGKDKNFWSIRVNADVRIIIHKTEGSFLLCYVDHHDRAYSWAERRKLETHPKTGAAQLVEIRERVQEIVVPSVVQGEPTKAQKPALLAGRSDEELLGYGVPREWLGDVRRADEDSLLRLTDHLPAEAAEAVLELATGGKPRVLTPEQPVPDPFDHPDARRRFRIMTDAEELQRALDYPWDKWTVFLHPEQREWVERRFNGPARVSGSAGTGKTIVALHRAVHVARTDPDSRVLLATFSDTLAHALHARLRRLIGNEPRLAERIDVHALDAVALRLYKAHLGMPRVASREEIREILRRASEAILGHKFAALFVLTEWDQVVDAWQLQSWEAYRDVARLGRRTRLSEAQRRLLWAIFAQTLGELNQRGLLTQAGVFSALTSLISSAKIRPFQYAVLDEAQDVSVAQLRFLAALRADRPDSLFFAGDFAQRILQQPFSWRSLGIDVRGRSRTLRVNYRTSHQIRMRADKLLNPETIDIDGNRESRADTISVFNGPPPLIQKCETQTEETAIVASWLSERATEGLLPHEMAVFIRSASEIGRAQLAVTAAGLQPKILDEHVETTSGYISVCTMHLAKGLEFRAVAVMACDDEVIPLQQRIEDVGDEADLQDVYDTERHLLYVACTRARDHLLVTSAGPASEFLEDLLS